MRLFIGVELDDGVKSAAAAAAAALKDRLGRQAPSLVARWIPEENLHITLWFIGEVPDDRAGVLHGALDRPFPVPPFALTLAGCGAFPPSGPARVLWIGVREGQSQMSALYREIEARLVPLGYAAERRAYTAHLTIARVKDPGRGTGKAVRDALAETRADCGSARIPAVTLFRSRLSPRGAAYEPLLRVPLI